MTTINMMASASAHAPEITPASGLVEYAWLLVAIPLVSAGVLLAAGRRADRWGHWLGVAASAAAACLGAALTIGHLSLPAAERVQEVLVYRWVPAGELSFDVGMRIDPLSLTFVMLVTFVGTLIHIYSVAYMEHDRDRRRFFAYLNLFVASMLLLVLGNSYPVLFVGWEGVGLASYLLIGFWNFNPDYAVAAKKAFVMNRVGDMGMIIAMMALFSQAGGLTFGAMEGAMPTMDGGWATFIGIFLLVAACGKSAQFPLQAWLGDAMAGPTPVSALIHAATMVTAGVYLMVRSGPVYLASPDAALAVCIIGAITLTFGAIVGAAKDDMKKVLAASTMSQIGYMMLAAGLGPVGAAFGIFHLLTHGFFKAGMFLGAGSVMHAMNDEVDMRGFGALAKKMPITWITFMMGWLAIIGFPLLSGFWSKDKIIEAAFIGEGARPWIFGWLTIAVAGLTAFYMSRLFFMVFHGKARWEDSPKEYHPHESPALMTIPMIIIAVGSVALGGILAINNSFVGWLEPSVGHVEHGEPVMAIPAIMVATLAFVAIGVGIAWWMYVRNEVPTTAPAGSFLTRAARRDLYQDAFNEGAIMRPGQFATRALVWGDVSLVDGAVMGLAGATAAVGRMTAKLQTGYVRSYAALMLLGVAISLLIVLATWL